LVLDLSAMSRAEKVAYATMALGAIAAVRGTHGLPHWLVVDEAHHIAPADGSPAGERLTAGNESLGLVTLSARDLAPGVRAPTDRDAIEAAVRTLTGRPESDGPIVAGGRLERGEALLADLGGGSIQVERFRVAQRRLAHRRHARKYAEGELPPDRSFYFRGP